MKSLIFGFAVLNLLALSACSPSRQATAAAGDSTEIVGGQTAASSDVIGKTVTLSTVALMTGRDGQILSFCTGTLIASDLVLTAGHCTSGMNPADVVIFFGSQLPTDKSAPGVVQAAKFLVNPEFVSQTSRFNDVALIKLEKPAPAGFAPVAMLEPSYVLTPGTEILLSGFGVIEDRVKMVRTKELNLVRVKVVSADEKVVVTDQNEGRGACAGDSGGPAYLETPKGLLVFGDTRGPQPGSLDCRHFGEYTYASKFKDFIVSGAKTLGAVDPTFVLPELDVVK